MGWQDLSPRGRGESKESKNGPKQSQGKKPENSVLDQSMRTGFGHEKRDKSPSIGNFYFKNFEGPTVEHRELYSILCNGLYGKRI